VPQSEGNESAERKIDVLWRKSDAGIATGKFVFSKHYWRGHRANHYWRKMNKEYFESCGVPLPVRIESVVPAGADGLEVEYIGEEGRRMALDIFRDSNGRVAISGGAGEVVVPVPTRRQGSPSWGEVVEALHGMVEFPATDQLFWAIGEARMEAAAEAIDDGADVRATNASGLLPLDALAISFGCRADAVRLIFVDQGRPKGAGEHLLADKLRDMDELAMIWIMLLNAGAVDQSGFRDAVRSGDFETAAAELAAGASIDAITLNRVPILVERMLHRDAAGVAWLLAAGANPDWEQPAGDAPVPVFISEAHPHLRGRPEEGFVLTPLSAAQLAEFPEGIELLAREKF
jgi:hypothetical protein